MKVEIKGNCLSGDYSRLEVSTSDRFRLLLHEDSQSPTSIPLDIDNIIVDNHLVSIGQEHRVNVVEHLFSALYGLNLFNVEIDVFGNEIPFFDGSSQKFVEMLGQLREQNLSEVLRLDNNILVAKGTSSILYEPSGKDTLIIEMELFHPYIKSQSICLEINKENYLKEIAPARTFAFVNENDPRLKNLPAYGIGITKNNIYSKEPLRFQNELVRHKILDLLGDLYVLKKKLIGKITCKNTSHHLNLKFVRKLVLDFMK
jgi:UDP-3-O-[3-hydroxymyristoyl] N-acetylglucosamine deacetylase